MKTWTGLALLLVACVPPGDRSGSEPAVSSPEPCSKAWYQAVEARVSTGDGRGHGPDLGSSEWQSVVEFKLEIRGRQAVPERGTHAWCLYIDRLLEAACHDRR